MQSRKMSAVETAVGTLIGYSIATAANYYILPLFGHKVTVVEASHIGIIFTVISLIRGYLVRRLFNWLWMKNFQKDVGLPATSIRTMTELRNKMRSKGWL